MLVGISGLLMVAYFVVTGGDETGRVGALAPVSSVVLGYWAAARVVGALVAKLQAFPPKALRWEYERSLAISSVTWLGVAAPAFLPVGAATSLRITATMLLVAHTSRSSV